MRGAITKILLVATGGAAGSVLRYAVSDWVQRVFGSGLPWGTFVVNLSGCFLMGLLAGAFQQRFLVSPEVRVLLLVGVLGGYTTFSAFALETLRLAQGGAFVAAGVNALGSPLLALGGAWAGDQLSRLI
jgi:CrcB protein